MCDFMVSRLISNIAHGEKRTRSVAQIIEKPCVHNRQLSPDAIHMKLCQTVHFFTVNNNTVYFRTIYILLYELGHAERGLPYMQTTDAQASIFILSVSPKPSLFELAQ